MTDLECDVAVVGGSLAGSAAAAALARGGAAVVVLEKSRFPRPKICGSFLSHDAVPVLERMGALAPIKAAGAETIGRFTLVRPEGKSVEGDLPTPVLSISRERLDTIVAAAAAHAGAAERFGTAVLSFDGDLPPGRERPSRTAGWPLPARRPRPRGCRAARARARGRARGGPPRRSFPPAGRA